jgi:hypothetical protein
MTMTAAMGQLAASVGDLRTMTAAMGRFLAASVHGCPLVARRAVPGG